MESSAQVQPDAVMMPTGNGRGKVRLLTRQSLDGRTKARKRFDAVVEGIASDLGGEAHLTTVQRHLVAPSKRVPFSQKVARQSTRIRVSLLPIKTGCNGGAMPIFTRMSHDRTSRRIPLITVATSR